MGMDITMHHYKDIKIHNFTPVQLNWTARCTTGLDNWSKKRCKMQHCMTCLAEDSPCLRQVFRNGNYRFRTCFQQW